MTTMWMKIALSISLLAAPWTTGCGATCDQVANQIGLTGKTLSQMADAFLADHKKYPSGDCGTNTPNTIDSCIRTSEDRLASFAQVICNQKPTADRDSSTSPLAPFSSQSYEAYIKLVPGLSVEGAMSASATIKAFCDYTIFHNHDGSGPPEVGPDPATYLDRQVLAHVDFELKATLDTEVTFTQNGVATTETISAGDSCKKENYTFKACHYADDGLACNVPRPGEPPPPPPIDAGRPLEDLPPGTPPP